ncbi:helix-turn-helix domain-containing protein [Alicyclobacillus vulcanalis]|uniref:Uncharacterized membrane protein YkvA, DUF1232 family n=1 Tax=Alicyclobacillus vulcanalis TaxID=252246 RepID=A0A1N7PTJ5_9BACL|nr:helix-turn-helix domain-containing protein [Alicyclobacillus vulcanalis]SIT13865.1 Uncharacterized membrane protein YkvA, DUF1232 family [Alicyclobacillus vulcanalis]
MGPLEETVKTLLQQKSMSMRQLAMATGISVSTISKMISGKQRVNLDYLRRMADALGVPPQTLAEAAGVPWMQGPGTSRRPPRGDMASHETELDALLRYLGLEHLEDLRLDIEKELDKYEAYAETDEGRQLIAEKYHAKRGQIQGVGGFLRDLDDMYERLTHPATPASERRILASGILYFLLATDAIPDYLFPAGYLDDAIAIQIVQERLSRARRNRSRREAQDEAQHGEF